VEKPSAVKQPSGLIPPLGLLTPATSEPAAQSPAPATTAKPATSSGQSTSDDDWILARAGDHYTLQLLASRDRGTLDAFVTRHKLSGELHQFSLTRDGQRLFVQLFGDFASRDAANQALGKLPADVRSQKPWLRSFSSIQRIIREQGR
jgi:DamX protein